MQHMQWPAGRQIRPDWVMSNTGGAREAGGGGGLLAPAVGPEAHLLLARPGCLLEWCCHRSPLLAKSDLPYHLVCIFAVYI